MFKKSFISKEITVFKKRIGVLRLVLIYLSLVYLIDNFQNSKSHTFIGVDVDANMTSIEVENYWKKDFEPLIAGTTGPISINKSTKEELEYLNGVGSVMSERILLYIEEFGEFTDVNQLLDVKGINEEFLEKNLDYIIIE